MRGKSTNKQRLLHFICYPILYFVFLYLLYFILSYFVNGEIITFPEKVLEIAAAALGVSISHWISVIYPSPKPSKGDKKSVKEYVKQFVTDGTPFNKFMLMVYALSVLVVITVIWLTVIGYL